MSWRRLKVLISALPPDSALSRSDPDMAGWTVTDHLLATTVDLLQIVAHNSLVGPHADPKSLKRLKPPKQMDRPGFTRRRRRQGTTLGQLAAMGARPTYVKGEEHG